MTRPGRGGGAEAGDEGSEEPADSEYYEYDEPQKADLVVLEGDATQLIDERELETTTDEFLQLDVDIIDATLEDGSEATVEVPGGGFANLQRALRDPRGRPHCVHGGLHACLARTGWGYGLQLVLDGISVEYGEDV